LRAARPSVRASPAVSVVEKAAEGIILIEHKSERRKGESMAQDIQVKREIVLEADAETLQKMRKEGHARGFTVYCDEAERTGGENSAPPPLAYFSLALGF
jgi:hypothetical protein